MAYSRLLLNVSNRVRSLPAINIVHRLNYCTDTSILCKKIVSRKIEKDDKKTVIKHKKSSQLEIELSNGSLKLEKKKKPLTEKEMDTKVVPSSSKKMVSSTSKLNINLEKQSQNKSKALKGNHQVITSTRDSSNKRKNESDQLKTAVTKKSISSVSIKNSVSKNSDSSLNKGNINKKPLTNVTINSPKHKRKELHSDKERDDMLEEHRSKVYKNEQIFDGFVNERNKPSEKYDIALNNHKRFRTRTLEPEEIKIVDKLVQNIEYSDNNVSESKIEKKLVAQSKSFFVSLDEKEGKSNINIDPDHKHIEKNKDENEELSYEDDFESYESDFESFNSSGKSSKLSSDSEIDEASLSSTTSGLSSLNNINQSKMKNDKTIESGSCELSDSQKLTDMKSDKNLEKIEEITDTNNIKIEYLPQSLASLTDEGFDENSAGLLCSINNSSTSSKIDDKSNQLNTKSNSLPKAKIKSNYAQRAHDLKELIVLDHVKYVLFEMFPMSYDTFITIHGKSNMTQAMCQTNDDYIDEDVQTDLIETENKWTQHPIQFSENNIIYDKSNDRDKKCNRKGNLSALEVYLNQKLGCGTDSLIVNSMIQNKLSIDRRLSIVKLTKFISRTGKCVLNYLEDLKKSSSEEIIALKRDSSDETLSYSNKEKYIHSIVKQRPLEKIQFSNTNSNIILTIHPANTKDGSKVSVNIDLQSIICIWMLKGSILKPIKMLGTIGNVKCCEISKGLSGMVVAGLDDGNILAWNLKEDEMWFENLFYNDKLSSRKTTAEDNDTDISRICSFHSGYDICKSLNQNRYQWGSSVEVMFSKSISKSDTASKDNTNQQVYLLQEFGLLSIWIVTRKQPAYKNITNADNYHSQWSTISLVKTNIVNLNRFVLSSNEFRSSYSAKSRQFSHKASSSAKKSRSPKSQNRQSKKGIIRAFTDDEPEIELSYPDRQTETKETLADEEDVKSSSNLICTMMTEHRTTGDILIASGNCQILSYSPKSIRRNVDVYKCEDTGSCVTCIETSTSDLPFFFSSCSNYIVHLYSKKSSKPLRSFFYGQNDTDIQAYKQFTLSYDFYNFANSNADGLKRLKNNFWLDWCSSNAHMFFTFFADGTIALWDLFCTDVSPKLYFNYLINNDTGKKRFLINGKILPFGQSRTDSVKYLMILHLSDGQIQLHILDERHFTTKFSSKEEELHLLKTYFELL